MKRTFIASLVAGIILLIYQSLSWMVLHIHENAMKFNPNQDEIMGALQKNISEEGLYMLPNLPPGTSMEEHQKAMESNTGKPWVMLSYHNSLENNMGKQMGLGLLLNLLGAFLVAMLMDKAAPVLGSFASRFMFAMTFSFFILVQSELMNWNWWHTPGHYLSGEIIDTLLGGVLCSAWLSWYMGRKTS